jgi:hypothetical protein
MIHFSCVRIFLSILLLFFMPKVTLFFLCLFTMIAQAQESFFRNNFGSNENSYVEVVALFSRLPTSGFAPIRVIIANRTISPARLSLSFESKFSAGYSRKSSHVKSSFSLAAEKESVMTTDLLVPVAAISKDVGSSSGDIDLSLNATVAGVVFGQYNQNTNLDKTLPYVLMSEAVYTPNASTLDAHVATSSGRSYRSAFAGKFDPKNMPEDWRAYAGYDRIIMTDIDWMLVSPGARYAMLQWNRMGGVILIQAINENTKFSSLGISDYSQNNEEQRGLGKVIIMKQDASLNLEPANVVNLVTREDLPKVQFLSAANDFESNFPSQGFFSSKNFYLPIFMIILLLFAIFVGPLNLFVFAKSGMRHKLFYTTPIISIIASLIMIAVIFIQDGFGGMGARAQLIEVVSNDKENNSYVHQEQFSRTGVLFGNQFNVKESAVLSPVSLAASRWVRLSDNSETDHHYSTNFEGSMTRMTGDWFQSRSEQAQIMSAVIPSRGRIESVTETKVPTFVSSIDCEISQFFYRSDDKYWRSSAITAGKKFACTECSKEDFEQFVKICAEKFAARNAESVNLLSQRENHFIALSENARAIDTFSGIKWKSTNTVITGAVTGISANIKE